MGIQFDWSYFFGLFSSPSLYNAALVTLAITVLSWFAGMVLGFILAMFQRSKLKILTVPTYLFMWVIRGTPLLVQIIIIYNAVPLLLDFTSTLLAIPFVAGALALTINSSVFSAEIFRSGLISVDKGQIEAATALGMRPSQIMWHVSMKQALRVIIPPLSNEFITVLKGSSMVSVISVTELTLAGQRLYTSNFKIIESLLGITIFYLAMTTIFTFVQQYIEMKLDKTAEPNKKVQWIKRFFATSSFEGR